MVTVVRCARTLAVYSGVCVCVGVGSVMFGASAAEARSPAEAHAVSHVYPAVTAVAAGPIEDAVCGLLKYPVQKGVGKILGLFADEDFVSIAGALAGDIADQYVCHPATAKLHSILKAAVTQRPAIRSRIGPWAFLLTASITSTAYGSDNEWDLHWTTYDPSSSIRSWSAYYRFDGSDGVSQWYQFPRNGLVPKAPEGTTIQFALRLYDDTGLVSPWSYSVWYRP